MNWCTLCYADRRAVSVAVAVSIPHWTDYPSASGDLGESPPSKSADPLPGTCGWPCPHCHTDVAMAADACPTCGGRFLAEVADSRAFEVDLPGLGRIATGTRRGRVTLAITVGLSMLTGIMALAFVLGSLL